MTVDSPRRANAESNHCIVTILSDPEDYHEFLKELGTGDITEKSRQLYALKAFNHTAEYDEAISDFFRKKFAGDGAQQLSLRYVSKDTASQHKVHNAEEGQIWSQSAPEASLSFRQRWKITIQSALWITRLYQPTRFAQCLAFGERIKEGTRVTGSSKLQACVTRYALLRLYQIAQF